MAALETLMDELYHVRREVFLRQDYRRTKFAVYYGRLVEIEMKRDPDIMRHIVLTPSKVMMPNMIMGALLQADYGLPEYAVAIHVDGKPYHTFSLERQPHQPGDAQ